MPHTVPPALAPPLSLFATLDLARIMADIEATYAVPWYWPVPERSVVRVFDGPRLSIPGRDPAECGARQIAKVAAILATVIGHPPARGIQDGEVAELEVPAHLFAAAALALRMEYRCMALESNFILNLVRDRRAST